MLRVCGSVIKQKRTAEEHHTGGRQPWKKSNVHTVRAYLRAPIDVWLPADRPEACQAEVLG